MVVHRLDHEGTVAMRNLVLCLTMLGVSVDAVSAEDAVQILKVPASGRISNWAGLWEDGQGVIYVTAGDHGSKAGNSWVYRYDPKAPQEGVVPFLDVQKHGEKFFDSTGIGHGKIHVPPLIARDGRAYISTYHWHDDRGSVAHYEGSLLFSFLPAKPEQIVCHGIAFPGEGTVAAQYVPDLNGYAALLQPSGRFAVYSLEQKKVIFYSAIRGLPNSRLLARDAQQRLYFHDDAGGVRRWDPQTQAVERVPITIPSCVSFPPSRSKQYRLPQADFIRVMQPVSDKELLGVTNYGIFFLYNTATGQTTNLGHALDQEPAPGPHYVPDLALNGAKDTVYYCGGIENAIGGYGHQNPLIAFNFRTGKKTVLLRLAEEFKKRKVGARFQWNFGILLSRDGKTLYLCPDGSGGTVWLVRIELGALEPK